MVAAAMMAGCDTVPRLDEAGQPIPVKDAAGNPVIDEEGNPAVETESVLNTDKMQEVAGTVSTILPWPWNLIVAGGAGVAASVIVGKRKAKP